MHQPITDPKTAQPVNNDFTLPVIRRAKSVKVVNNGISNTKLSPYDQSFNTLSTDFLMSNWADKKSKNNRVHTPLDPR